MTHAKWGLAAAVGALLAMAPAAGAQGQNTGATTDPGNPKTTGTSSDKAPASPTGASSASTTPDPSSSSGSSSAHKSSDSSSMSGTGTSSDTASSGSASSSGKKMDKSLMEGLQKLHAANQGEMQMGQMGEQMAQNSQVKQFAKQMVDDHSKNDQQLTSMAQTMGVQLTGKEFQSKQKDAQKEMKKVQGKTGAEFDKAFMDQMVKDHEKDVKDVEKLAKKARDDKQTELASALEQTHTMIQSHLDMAKQIQKSTKDEAKSAQSGSSSSSMGTGSSGSSSKKSSGSGSSSSSTPSTSSGATGATGSDSSK